MLALFIEAALLQDATCSGDAARHLTEAARLGETFDLTGAAAEYDAAARGGCASAAAAYIRGLIAARQADAQFGSAASLEPLKQAISSLESTAAQNSSARAMMAVLRAAIPAAQHERPEMALRIEKAFGPDMNHLLRMQLAYDVAKTRENSREIDVHRYVPAL